MNDHGQQHIGALASAITRILRPLVRILIRNGVSYKTCTEWLRWTYVDIANREFAIADRPQTKSRIAVLTGISRVEVDKQLNKTELIENTQSEQHHRGARILTGWNHDQRFTDAAGHPKALPFEGDEASFTALVDSYGGGITPRSVLDELIRVECAQLDEQKYVHLLRPYFIADKPDSETSQLDILGFSASQLLDTIDHNIYSGEPTKLQLIASHDEFPLANCAELKTKLQEIGRHCIQQADDCLYAEASTPDSSNGTRRVGLGVYYFEQDESSRSVDQALTRKADTSERNS